MLIQLLQVLKRLGIKLKLIKESLFTQMSGRRQIVFSDFGSLVAEILTNK